MCMVALKLKTRMAVSVKWISVTGNFVYRQNYECLRKITSIENLEIQHDIKCRIYASCLNVPLFVCEHIFYGKEATFTSSTPPPPPPQCNAETF